MACLHDMIDKLWNDLGGDMAAFNLIENHIKKNKINKINKIVKRLSWNICHQKVEEVKKFIDMYNEEEDEEYIDAIPLTEKEWNTVLHPSGDWCLYMTFDHRALQDKESYAYNQICLCEDSEKKQSHTQIELTVRRGERFTSTSTLRDVLKRIKEGLGYGYYEGIVPVGKHFLYSDNFDGIPIYKLQTGT